MREILFKAKRIYNGEWVEGSLVTVEGGKYVVDDSYFRLDGHHIDCDSDIPVFIDENTICQYTGLTDKNGNKIWENDVVFVTDEEGCSGQVDTGLGEIEFLEGLWYICGRVQNGLYDIDKCFQIEVIGNIFDNAELVGGVDNE